MSYIQRNNIHKPEERKYNPPKKCIWCACYWFYPAVNRSFLVFTAASRPGNVFYLTPGAQVSQQTGHTHTCTHPGRIDGCVARLKWIRRIENNNVVKKNFIQLVVVRQPETWRKTVSKSRRMICVWKLQLPGTNKPKKEKTAFSLLRSSNLFFLFFTPNDNKNLGAL